MTAQAPGSSAGSSSGGKSAATLSGFVRYSRSDATDGDGQYSANYIELMTPDREVVDTFELKVDTWTPSSNCARLSQLRDWILVRSDGGFRVLPTSMENRLAYHLEIAGPSWATSAEFFAGGPSLITTDASSGDVTLWEPVDAQNAEWKKSVIFTGRNQVLDARSDAEGRRLLIVESPEGPTRRGFVFSLDANRVWRDVGTGFKGMDVEFLADGSVASAGRDSGRQLIWLHDLDQAVTAAKEALAADCQPVEPDLWRTSPCWPSGY